MKTATTLVPARRSGCAVGDRHVETNSVDEQANVAAHRRTATIAREQFDFSGMTTPFSGRFSLLRASLYDRAMRKILKLLGLALLAVVGVAALFAAYVAVPGIPKYAPGRIERKVE